MSVDNITYMQVTSEIITSLEKARSQAEDILDNSTEMIVFFDGSGKLIHGNATFCHYIDRQLEDIMFSPLAQWIGKSSWDTFIHKINLLTTTDHVFCQASYTSPQGKNVIMHWVLRVYLAQSAYGPVYQASGRDMTAFEETREKVNQLYSILPLGILTLNEQGKIEALYSEFAEVLLATNHLHDVRFYDCLAQLCSSSATAELKEAKQLLSYLGKPFNSGGTSFDVNRFLVIKTNRPDESSYQWIRLNFHPIVIEGILKKYFITLQDATKTKKQEKAVENLRHLSLTDPLTGVGNRRAFEDKLLEEWKRCSRSRDDMGLILIDVDFFKLYNDHYGHQQGDECLKQVASTLTSSVLRSSDGVFRYGGEEFAIIVPITKLAGLQVIAQTIIDRFAEQKLEHHARTDGYSYVSVSMGLVALDCAKAKKISSARMIKLADEALYTAKSEGRNRFSLAKFSSAES